MPTYLLISVGVRFNIERFAPEQKIKNSLRDFMMTFLVIKENSLRFYECKGRPGIAEYYSTKGLI